MQSRRVALVLTFPLCLFFAATSQASESSAPTLAPLVVKPTPLHVEGALPTLAPLVESVRATVVNVQVQSKATPEEIASSNNGNNNGKNGQGSGDNFIDRYFGGETKDGQPAQPSTPPPTKFKLAVGSGFVIDASGLILTNHHVVEGSLAVHVTFDDGREFDAVVLGTDSATDVALLRLKGKFDPLPAVKLGDSEALKVGDWVMAIGNPYGLASSVSAGIVSAKARNIQRGPYDDFLQTDAAINPGNSGGPLFNMRGEVVGMNTALVGGSTGIGFAVPSNLIKALVPQLQKAGKVTRAYLGLQVEDVPPDVAKALKVPFRDGALVIHAEPDSPCARAGIRSDDVVVSLDGQRITSGGALTRTVALKTPGSRSTVVYYRGPQRMEVRVTLAVRPDPELAHVAAPAIEAPDLRKIGLSYRDADPRASTEVGGVERGALVVDVALGSVAQRAGLTPGMVIIAVGGHPVRGHADLTRYLKAPASGSTLLLRVHIPNVPGAHLRALILP